MGLRWWERKLREDGVENSLEADSSGKKGKADDEEAGEQGSGGQVCESMFTGNAIEIEGGRCSGRANVCWAPVL